jgi:O-antigen/teichoic acid export membrane protein
VKAAVLVRQLITRVSWGIGDQVVSSLTNFLISIYAARELPGSQFGAFSLVFVTYAFILNGSRGLATEPLLVRHSGEATDSWRQAVRQTGGMALCVGFATGVVAAAIGLIVGGESGRVWLALAVGLPGLMLQDSWRYVFFSVGRGSQAFVNDFVWALVLLPLMLLLRFHGHVSGAECMLAWAFAGTAAAAVGTLQAGLRPHIAGAASWLRTNWDLCPRYMAENLSVAGARQVRYTALAVFGGLAAVGHVRAAEVLMGPFLVLVMGVGLVAIPEAVSIVQRWPHRLRAFCLLLGAGESAAAGVWGLIVIILLPHGLGQWLLGPIWKSASPLVLPAVLSGMLACFSVGGSAGLHALGQARRSLRAQLNWAAFYLVGGIAGAIVDGARGTSWAVVGASFAGAVYFQIQLDRGIDEHLASLVPTEAPAEAIAESVFELPAEAEPESEPEPESPSDDNAVTAEPLAVPAVARNSNVAVLAVQRPIVRPAPAMPEPAKRSAFGGVEVTVPLTRLREDSVSAAHKTIIPIAVWSKIARDLNLDGVVVDQDGDQE